jgi:hypothetical protein
MPQSATVEPSVRSGLALKWDGIDTFRIDQVAQILSISRSLAFEMAANGAFPV